ncbi:MAG: 2-oxoglutarate dehydrogenase complex dihydrolipoyllysine-residue succinyltransferase [Chthonomonadales bacterium]
MSVEIKIPQLGESIVEATIGRWTKKQGDAVAAGEVIAELETDKVNLDLESPSDGIVEKLMREEGDTVRIDEVVAVIGNSSGAPSAPKAEPKVEAAPAKAEPAVEHQVQASPVAKALAADKAVDLTKVAGSGPGGKITKDDVASFVEAKKAPAAPAVAATPVPAPAPTIVSLDGRPVERIRMTRRRQTIMVRLKEAQNTAAMLTTFNEVDMSAVMELRKRHKEGFLKKNGVGLGFMSFFTKAVVSALKTYPMINAEIQGTEIVAKKFYDIGVAVSTDEGLVVPVVRDADQLSFAGIEKAIGAVAVRAREGKLTLAELQGGTFTITNGGVFGSLLSTPILNTPQVGILGMHTIQERPVARDGQVVIRPMMYLALSYDHRIVDGSEAVRFLVHIKQLIEDPSALMLEG